MSDSNIDGIDTSDETLTTNQETEMQDQQDETMESDAAAEQELTEQLEVGATEGEVVTDVGDAPAEPEVKAAKEPKGPPAWEAFTAALSAHAAALGSVQVSTQKGFIKFVNPTTGHKLYVAKQAKKLARIDTTLPVKGQPGTYDLEKPNGRITCHLDADLANVEGFLLMLASEDVGKIPAPKRAAKAETPAAPAAS